MAQWLRVRIGPLREGEQCPGLLTVAAARCGWKPRANPLLFPCVIARNVSDALARPSALVRTSRRLKSEPKEPARSTFATAKRAERAVGISAQNAAPQSIGCATECPIILVWRSVHSLIHPSPRRLHRSGRNLDIRGSSSGTISCTSHKRDEPPGPLADFKERETGRATTQGIVVLGVNRISMGRIYFT
jgi:hypothetical protein